MTKTELTIDTKKLLSFFAMAFVFVVVVISFASWVTTKNPTNDTNSTPPPQYLSVTCPKESSAFRKLVDDGQVVKLIPKPASMYVVNGVFENAKTIITKNDTEKSKVACGYLYVKVHTGDGALVSYQDLYINPENFGGHINIDNQYGPGDRGSEYSEYIFSLDDIRYWKSKNRGEVLHADWASLLNAKPTLSFIIGLNVKDKSSFVDEISIAYKCKDPVTGGENTGCGLTASEPEFGKATLP